jgi:hypothetical protein
MSLMVNTIKMKVELLSGETAVTTALQFMDKTKETNKEKFKQDMEEIARLDQKDSMAIKDAIANNPELKAIIDNDNDNDCNNNNNNSQVNFEELYNNTTESESESEQQQQQQEQQEE